MRIFGKRTLFPIAGESFPFRAGGDISSPWQPDFAKIGGVEHSEGKIVRQACVSVEMRLKRPKMSVNERIAQNIAHIGGEAT
jgi:hypothetical protein